MSECTGSSVTLCSKRCKYSPSVSKEPSELCLKNNLSFVDAVQTTTVRDIKNDMKNESSSSSNENKILETLQEIKLEVCSSKLLLSSVMNGSIEKEILKTLLEIKAEQCNFQKEVLTRLQSIETEVNRLKNNLCMGEITKTHINVLKSDTSDSLGEAEKRNMEKSKCRCKHLETLAEVGKTKPSFIYLDHSCETDVNTTNNDLCMCKHPDRENVRGSTESSVTEIPSKTEINNIEVAQCPYKHHETQIKRETSKPSIIEPSCELKIIESENALSMQRHFETCVQNDNVNSHAEINEIDKNYALSLCGHPEALIIPFTKRSDLPFFPVDSTGSLEEVEQWLEDKNNVQILTQHFCSIGGYNVRDTTKRILSRTFTQNIAVNINWTGKNQKYPLSRGCLVKVIIAAVKLTHRKENVTEKMVEEHIKVWFRFAKDRNGGRERRRYANFYLKEEEMLIIP